MKNSYFEKAFKNILAFLFFCENLLPWRNLTRYPKALTNGSTNKPPPSPCFSSAEGKKVCPPPLLGQPGQKRKRGKGPFFSPAVVLSSLFFLLLSKGKETVAAKKEGKSFLVLGATARPNDGNNPGNNHPTLRPTVFLGSTSPVRGDVGHTFERRSPDTQMLQIRQQGKKPSSFLPI